MVMLTGRQMVRDKRAASLSVAHGQLQRRRQLAAVLSQISLLIVLMAICLPHANAYTRPDQREWRWWCNLFMCVCGGVQALKDLVYMP